MLLKFCRNPINLDEKLQTIVENILIFCVIIHTIMSIWICGSYYNFYQVLLLLYYILLEPLMVWFSH